MTQQIDEPASGLRQLIIDAARQYYSEAVIDHWVHPRNPGPMPAPDGHARLIGACGDTMEIFLRVRDGVVVEARFMTDGCTTSIASASMAVELATGKALGEAVAAASAEAILDALGGLPEGSEHCAALASETLRAAVRDYATTRREPWKRGYRPSGDGSSGRGSIP